MIIKKSAILFILFFVMSLPVWANEMTGNINLIAGKKIWSDDWDPISKQDEFGVSFDIKDKSWPVSIVIEAFDSSGEKTEIMPTYQGAEVATLRSIEAITREYCFGIKKIIDIQSAPVKPFLGVGLAYVINEIDGKFFQNFNDHSISTFSVDDSTLGFWMSGGIYVTFFDRINAGVIARMSWAEADFNKKFEVGGEHYGIFIGYHW
ncbi:MAG: hypothetical protein WC799_19270 [Desulfobacteraceae bacterium]|jgi:hypothetical protein